MFFDPSAVQLRPCQDSNALHAFGHVLQQRLVPMRSPRAVANKDCFFVPLSSHRDGPLWYHIIGSSYSTNRFSLFLYANGSHFPQLQVPVATSTQSKTHALACLS